MRSGIRSIHAMPVAALFASAEPELVHVLVTPCDKPCRTVPARVTFLVTLVPTLVKVGTFPPLAATECPTPSCRPRTIPS